MTVNTASSQTTVFSNGSTYAYSFPFIAVSSSDIEVILYNSSNQPTTLSPSQYTVTLNPVATGAIWSIGGTVTYPLSGSPLATGNYLTISRILPLTQNTSLSNQGDLYPQVIEAAIDIQCMETQQVSARTNQPRGTWKTNTNYNIGDIVQDGANGANTNNLYQCQNANLSGVWATDIANGDWSIFVVASVPIGGNITLTGDVTGSSSLGVLPATISANAVTNTKLAQMAADTVKMNNTGSMANAIDATMAQLNAVLGSFLTVKVQGFSSSGIYTPSAGMKYCIVEMTGGGGSGGCGSNATQVGAGGGGAAYTYGVFTASQIGGSQTVTIGAGGAAVSSGSGNNGGTTALGSLMTASGGDGGGGPIAATNTCVANGGNPGTTASGGTYTVTGSAGGSSFLYDVSGNIGGFTGTGGNSKLGGGGYGGATLGGGPNGGPGGFGAGGGGGGGSGTTSGAGGGGAVIITEFCSQ